MSIGTSSRYTVAEALGDQLMHSTKDQSFHPPLSMTITPPIRYDNPRTFHSIDQSITIYIYILQPSYSPCPFTYENDIRNMLDWISSIQDYINIY